MRYFKAVLSSITLLTLSLVIPVFLQWYGQVTGVVEPVGFYFFSFLIGFISLVYCVLLWISAASDKDVKDFF